jgi:periplasmic protein CpxP/Spy
MKKIILTAGICMATLFSLQAQQADTKAPLSFEQKVDKMMATLTSTCSLTPDQVTKVKPIVAETIKARMANKQAAGADKDKLKAADQASMKAENAKLDAILTPDQKAKLAAYEKQKQAEMQKYNSAAGE